MTNFNIQIVSDTVCPWCYVGKQRMEKGIAAYKEAHPDSKDTFSTNWLPFYLNPTAPTEGVDKRAYYNSKFGEGRTEQMFARLTEIGKADGIDFKYGGKTGNTRDSHRLIQLGKTKGPEVQTRVVEELFKAYFENEQDITSHKVLLDAGIKAGLGEDEVKGWLESDKGGRQVDKEVREAQLSNIHGVPNFTIQGKHELGGAQDPSAFLEIFERVKAAEAA
ncbi:MAG: hypothetical protein M1835_003539 [Candelina submexicana]|nr:MAG: hypothetical protein M1835_003539 [Candelina submexicana]